MIICASRRTDIPHYYSEWFMNRIEDGFVFVRNPRNPRIVYEISLLPEDVTCFVFWTKNPKPFLPYINKLENLGYSFYFQFTLTPYSHFIEKNLPDKSHLITVFRKLSQRIGPEKNIWRYDPVLFSKTMDVSWHTEQFEMLCSCLSESTHKCIFSFFDTYRHVQNICFSDSKSGYERILNTDQIPFASLKSLSDAFFKSAQMRGISLFSCCEPRIPFHPGILKSSCVDPFLIEEISGKSVPFEKETNQRLYCGCVRSVDIGAYNSCATECIYCYANKNIKSENLFSFGYKNHDSSSPILNDVLRPGDKIVKKEKFFRSSQNNRQKKIFDF